MMLRQSLFRRALRPRSTHAPPATQRAFIFGSRGRNPRSLDSHLDIGRLYKQQKEYDYHYLAFVGAGFAASLIGVVVVSHHLYGDVKKQWVKDAKKAKHAQDVETKQVSAQGSIQLDSATPKETYTIDGDSKRKVVIHDENGKEIVPTGNSTVPVFPRIIGLTIPTTSSDLTLSTAEIAGTEYTLVGLGLRTVSFLSIQVYLVGFYVATADIAALQSYLVRTINPIATTLVPSERDALRSKLLNPVEGEEIWTAILREAGCRSAFRIVPVRDTDFHHLRDGFVRAITSRSQQDPKAYGDEEFGSAVRQFKTLFNRGSVPKKKELILSRDGPGKMVILYSDGKAEQKQVLGEVTDERVSQLLWLNYLAGKKVASEPARQSVIDGVMEFVERPVGTVAAQVV
jgi:hypothetical protein